MTDTRAIAIVAGAGELPRVLAMACKANDVPYRVVVFEGLVPEWVRPAHPAIETAFEKLGGLFEAMRDAGLARVVFAGAMARPRLDPAKADATFAALAPELMAALQGGDDAALRFILSVFEGEGFEVVGADAVVPDLLPPAGRLSAAEPDLQAEADAARAAQIVAKLGEADVGQGAIVCGGICLAVETIGGTDRMLETVRHLPAHLRGRGGVLYKSAKPGQDRRMDLPAIGPDTVRAAQGAGLSGIVIAAGNVMLLDPEQTIKLANTSGLFLWVRPA